MTCSSLIFETAFELLQIWISSVFISAHSCSYLWFPWIRSHGTGGTNANLNSLSDCIKFCQDSTSCVFVDWNAQDKSCWTYTSVPDMYEAINMYSFRKYCSVPRTASKIYT